jgi:hypothetical protein
MNKKTKKAQLNTMVLDPVEGFALEHVEKPEGRLWRYGRSFVYLMKKNGDILEAFEPPSDMGETPEKLYRALFWEKEAEILFTLHSQLLEKLKLIGMYLLIGILLLLIFLIFSSLGGT